MLKLKTEIEWVVLQQDEQIFLKEGVQPETYETIKITRIVEKNKELYVYMSIRNDNESEWSEEFLSMHYYNVPFVKMCNPVELDGKALD